MRKLVKRPKLIIAFFIASCCALQADEKEATEEKSKPATDSFKWEVIKHGGQEYFALSQIASFYQFSGYQIFPETQSATFFHNELHLVFNSDGDHREIQVNNVRFSLINNTVWDDNNEQLLVSTVDLTLILDPVFRPSYIKVKDPELERQRPFTFILSGDRDLVEAIGQEQLLKEIESRGLRTAPNVSVQNTIPIEIFLRPHDETNQTGKISSFWFLKKNDPESWRLSIALGTALHSYLIHFLQFEDGALNPRGVEVIFPHPPRVRIELELSDRFQSYPKIRTAIADALAKSKMAIGKEDEDAEIEP